MINMMSDQE